jgi:hypothetical protein
MKLCKRCVKEIKLATHSSADIFELAASDSECEYWAHKAYLNYRPRLSSGLIALIAFEVSFFVTPFVFGFLSGPSVGDIGYLGGFVWTNSVISAIVIYAVVRFSRKPKTIELSKGKEVKT